MSKVEQILANRRWVRKVVETAVAGGDVTAALERPGLARGMLELQGLRVDHGFASEHRAYILGLSDAMEAMERLKEGRRSADRNILQDGIEAVEAIVEEAS